MTATKNEKTAEDIAEILSSEIPPAPEGATIYERLVLILAELPAIGKTERNTQQNFMFRSHDAVLNELNPLLAKHGVFIVPHVLERVTDQRSTGGGKTMYEVNLHIQYTFFGAYGAEGGEIVASAWGEGTDMGDKSTNKATTMAFKNVIAQVFAVSTAETVDTDGGSPEHTTGSKAPASRPSTNRPAAQPKSKSGGGLASSWGEWATRMEAIGIPIPDQPWWMSEPVAATEEKLRFVKANELLVKLTEFSGDLALHADAREVIQRTVAEVFGGVAVAGPPYRIGGGSGEDRFPTVDEWKAAQAEQENLDRDASGDTNPPETE